MLAEEFVQFGFVNILLIALGLLLFAAFVASIIWYPRGRQQYHWTHPLMPITLGALAAMIGVFAPHYLTQDTLHTPQARHDLLANYGGKVIKISLQDHWAVVQPAGCSVAIQHEIRRIRGHYWFTATYSNSFENGDGEVERQYAPLSRKAVQLACAAAVGQDEES